MAKKRAIRKAKEAVALKKLRCQQTIDGVPLAPSPSETISGEDDDSSGEDDDALSRYETATGLGDLPDVRPWWNPSGGRPPQSSWSRSPRRRRRRRRRQAPRWEGPLYPGPIKRGRRGCPY
jgi:hypothetical protein